MKRVYRKEEPGEPEEPEEPDESDESDQRNQSNQGKQRNERNLRSTFYKICNLSFLSNFICSSSLTHGVFWSCILFRFCPDVFSFDVFLYRLRLRLKGGIDTGNL